MSHHSSSGLSARFTAIAALAGALAAFATPAAAQVSDDVVKLAITNDQSSIYSAAGGYGVVMAGPDGGRRFRRHGARQEDRGRVRRQPEQAGCRRRHRQSLDSDTDHVDVIVDGGSSAVGMAVQAVTREKNKLFLITGSGTTALTNENCSPVGFQWSWDTYGLASGTATTLAKQGLDGWFFITADYTFGQVLEAQAGEIALQSTAPRSWARCAQPFNTADFSSVPAAGEGLQCQGGRAGQRRRAMPRPRSSRRTSLGLRRDGGQKLAALFLNITDVHALGLDTAQGLVITTSFYWDRTDASRAFCSASRPRQGTRRPSCRPAPYSARDSLPQGRQGGRHRRDIVLSLRR